MIEPKLLEEKHLRDVKSQEEYIDHIPAMELMTWPKHRLNVFDQLDDLKYIASSDEAKMTSPYLVEQLMRA